ncbi:M50 family metallopeptidase [Paenibacillus sp. P25]|nr:M50 family metallopeptidase [Paenibacillus sp. P25]
MTGISHVEIRETEPGVFFVKNTLNSKFVKMGIKEVEFLRLFESGADAKSLYQGELTEEQQDFLTAKFREWGFIEPQQHPDQPTEKTMMARLSRWKLSDLAIIRIVTLDPDPPLNRIAPLIQKLFHPAAIMIYVLLMMTAYGSLAGRMEVLFRLAAYQFTWQGLVLLYVLVIGTTIVHELAHALACKYYGGQVRRLGFMLFYLNPAMFCDVSDTYLFPRKGPKAVVLLAGIISQWILSALACLVYFLMEGTGHRAELLLYYAVTNIGLSLINLFPFVKLDGYWLAQPAARHREFTGQIVRLSAVVLIGRFGVPRAIHEGGTTGVPVVRHRRFAVHAAALGHGHLRAAALDCRLFALGRSGGCGRADPTASGVLLSLHPESFDPDSRIGGGTSGLNMLC